MPAHFPWLREYCDPPLDVRAIEQRLTMTGTKVEAIHRQGVPSPENFVVGRVLSAERHPDADRLRVCSVELGLPEGPARIVCGAPNVAAGQTVAVARPGARMPDGTQIKRAKLRGVASEGMILSAAELQIDAGGDGAGGIMVLDGIAPSGGTSAPGIAGETPAPALAGEAPAPGPAPGTPLQEVLPIAVEVLELEITPNRPDCLGVYGVARELHAATGAPLAPAPWEEDPGTDGPLAAASVQVQCPDLCPRFTARAFERVTVAPSPLWLKARLSAAGQRPINNVVDITNYVMLLTGQPLHAFDLDRVAGGTHPAGVARLTVRRAADGERVETLDGRTRTLDADMVLIADADGPTSIAGLMGGARSEVGETTTRVLMEVANWSGPNIHRSSWALGLRSEASSRFEKGLAPEQCMQAQALAAQLMIELCGATLLPGTIDIGEADATSPADAVTAAGASSPTVAAGAGRGGRANTRWRPRPLPRVRLRERRVEAILGVPVARARQEEILSALDFACEPADDGLDVTVPAVRRNDVSREVDLIEEVARIDGLERLPATLPARRGAAGRLTHAQRVRRAAEDALVGRGLHEIVGWSFADPALLDRLLIPAGHPLRNVVMLENPLSESQSMMRPTLLGSLLDAARHNVARGRADIAIFESGTVYRTAAGGESPADEHHGLGVLMSGSLAPRAWRGEQTEADFFAAKALLAALLDRFHVRWSVAPADWPFLHPGRSAAVLASAPGNADSSVAVEGRTMLGFLGELHPTVAAAWDLGRTAAFAIDLGQLAAVAPETVAFRAFGAFPPLRRDLAVTLPDGVPAEEVLARVRAAGGDVLAQADVFDVYTGAQVGEGRRSLALALSFRALDRTLTDDDVALARAQIVRALEEIGGELRG